MPSIHEFKKSRFLTKEDVGKGMLLTIKGWREENVAQADDAEDIKPVLDFVEDTKPLVTNSTKREIIAQICGSEEMNDWPGHKIVVFHDPTIVNRGKVVGGIGVRAPRIKPAPIPPGPRPPAPKPAPARPVAVPVTDEEIPGEDDSEVPF